MTLVEAQILVLHAEGGVALANGQRAGTLRPRAGLVNMDAVAFAVLGGGEQPDALIFVGGQQLLLAEPLGDVILRATTPPADDNGAEKRAKPAPVPPPAPPNETTTRGPRPPRIVGNGDV